MTVLLPIGEFSRMTYLTVKALRHYHDLGLLEPADIDPASGYRLYSTDQVPTALLISRFRDLEMPLDQVRAMLDAADLEARNQVILAHLERMEQRLERTQSTVASLKSLLELRLPLDVEHRVIPDLRVLAITELVASADCEAWLARAFGELAATLTALRVQPAGPPSTIYANEFFEESEGELVAYVALPDGASALDGTMLPGLVRDATIAGGDFAVALHVGSFADLDQTYGALGTFVNERGLAADGPIREHYLILDNDNPNRQRTEVCWPMKAGATPT